ncbi:phosphoribosylglycinamide formyltransferase [Oceanobacillus halotolerans]|uniref:phosphoribosylglycinamide formyltransferase n=1 Tax=Oceanobacillus halotolerans TaxID=2663380 RepID=UPI0013DA7B05|nr:phosphoribosylglycinamide formyltransferase [Oceanobacillus halotolerans]
MTQVKAAVFASGTGSNFQAIMEAGDLGCEIVLLVCDNPDATVIDKAKYHDIPVFVFQPTNYESKEAYEQVIIKYLIEANVSWIFLAGYMRIVGSTLLKAYKGKVINIHPSLLPQFPGKDGIEQALEAGVTKTGVTVHYIDAGIDTGPIIAQETVEVLPQDSITTLKKRIQKAEHELYPSVIKQLLKK